MTKLEQLLLKDESELSDVEYWLNEAITAFNNDDKIDLESCLKHVLEKL